MATITIPKVAERNKELIAVPRKIYEEFIAWQKKIKSVRTFKPTAAEKRAIEKGRREIARGEYVTLEELRHELDFNRK